MAPIPATGEGASASPKKILWVEDDSFLTNIIARKLQDQNWKLLYAPEAKSALEIARSEKPDAIVLDIILPGMDGMQILAQLKASDETKNIPVIVFSNVDDPEKIELSKKLGAEGFFVKAMSTLEKMVTEIQKVISR
jgi:DNA-binding response OmpR family regulator